jgi:hypothetical protein
MAERDVESFYSRNVQWILRPWVGPVITVALVTLTLSACSATASKSQPWPITSATQTTTPNAVGPFCAVQTPDSWKSAITSGQVAAEGTWSMVFALSPNGDKIVKEVLKGSVAHLEVGSSGGKQQTIATIANTQAGGFIETADFDGRWVVYVLGYSQQVANPWAIYAWDSQSAVAPHKIAASRLDAFLTGDPDVKVNQGKATWIAGVPTPGVREVHLFDLASDHDQIVTTAHISGHPFFADNMLVWPESKSPSGPTQMKAYDIVSGAMSNLPGALKVIQNGTSIASDGRTSAWTDTTLRQVWAWRTDWVAPKKIFDVGQGYWVGMIQLTGDIVTWTGRATYAADLRSGSYVKLTPEYGSSIAKGTHLEFSYNTTGAKSQYPPNISVVIDVSKLPPLPECSPSN